MIQSEQQAHYGQQQQQQGYTRHVALPGRHGGSYGDAGQLAAPSVVGGADLANGGRFVSRLFDGLDIASSQTASVPSSMVGPHVAGGHQGHQHKEGSYYDYAAADSQYSASAASAAAREAARCTSSSRAVALCFDSPCRDSTAAMLK